MAVWAARGALISMSRFAKTPPTDASLDKRGGSGALGCYDLKTTNQKFDAER